MPQPARPPTPPLTALDDIRSRFRRLNPADYPELAGLAPAAIYHGKMCPGGLYLAARMARGLGLTAGSRVLDIGCGQGASSRFLAERFGVIAFAVDWWIPATHLHARTRDCHGRIIPLHLDITQPLPFADDYFDAIFCMDAVHYFGADPAFWPHLLRHLRPGGRMCLGGPCFSEEFTPAQLANLPREYDDGTTLWPKEFSRYHSPPWWADQLRRTGLVNILECTELPDGVIMWEDDVLWNIDHGQAANTALTDARQIAFGHDHRPYLTHFVLTVQK